MGGVITTSEIRAVDPVVQAEEVSIIDRKPRPMARLCSTRSCVKVWSGIRRRDVDEAFTSFPL
jgi:hypothetical protein